MWWQKQRPGLHTQGGGGATSQGMQVPPEAGEGQEPDPPPEPLEGISPALVLPGRLILGLWPPDLHREYTDEVLSR